MLSGVVVLDEVESDSLEGGLDPVGGMRAEDPLKVIGVGHALLWRVPRALTGATVACAGWRMLIGTKMARCGGISHLTRSIKSTFSAQPLHSTPSSVIELL